MSNSNTSTIDSPAMDKHEPTNSTELRHESMAQQGEGSSPQQTSTDKAVSAEPSALHINQAYPRWKIFVWLAFILTGALVMVYFQSDVLGLTKKHDVVEAAPVAHVDTAPWDGVVTMTLEAQTAIGVTTAIVLKQTDPILLPILGTTKHDDTKMTKVLPLFKGRAEKVYVAVGDRIEPGMPLVDLYSADLAQGKTNYEIEKTQWEYVKKLLDVRIQLRASNSISEQLLLETQNDELRQRHEFDIAKEKLILFGLTEAEIASVATEQGARRARLTVRSPSSGVVISRNVVSGNIYDDSDVMLIIAPDDHLWVWGNVFERDLGMVELEQKWDVQFSFLDEHLSGKVEYISPNVDPGAHAVKIRTMIPNPGGKLKADMLVQGNLQIPPHPEFVTIPRISMTVIDGRAYAFTRVSGTTDKFVRHKIDVVHEKEDRVIIRRGLSEGDEVVVLGSLLMEQLYEENDMLTSGHASRSIDQRD